MGTFADLGSSVNPQLAPEVRGQQGEEREAPHQEHHLTGILGLTAFPPRVVRLDHHPLHRTLFEEAAHPPEVHACVLRFEESLAHALVPRLRRRGNRVPAPDTVAHLIVQTTESLVHRFVLRGIHDLDRAAFVDEVGRLLARYASGRAVQ